MQMLHCVGEIDATVCGAAALHEIENKHEFGGRDQDPVFARCNLRPLKTI